MKGSDPAFHTIFYHPPESASDLRAVILWSTEYRDPLIHQIIQRRSLLGRKIDAAVAASGLIKRSAKLASPRCVMKADPAVKRHPVIYMALILIGSVRLFLSSEYPILSL